MCLGLPGQVVDEESGHPDLSTVLVAGVRRTVNVGLLDDGRPIVAGEWLLIHMGFALSRMTPAEAQDSLDILQSLSDGLPAG